MSKQTYGCKTRGRVTKDVILKVPASQQLCFEKVVSMEKKGGGKERHEVENKEQEEENLVEGRKGSSSP